MPCLRVGTPLRSNPTVTRSATPPSCGATRSCGYCLLEARRACWCNQCLPMIEATASDRIAYRLYGPPCIPIYNRGHDGTHTAATALYEGRARAAYVEGNIRVSLRQAPPGLRHQLKQSDQG